MAKAKLLSKNGNVLESISLPEVFDFTPNKSVMDLCVKVYLANQRESNAHTKTRGEVSGSTRKLYRQKGTGNARRGSIRSPMMRGGGIVFGPKNVINYKKDINKKVKKIGIKSALSFVAQSDRVSVFDSLDLDKAALTKSLVKFIGNSEIKGKLSFILDSKDDLLLKASANIPNVSVKMINDINVYSLLNIGNVIFSKSAVETINNIWNK